MQSKHITVGAEYGVTVRHLLNGAQPSSDFVYRAEVIAKDGGKVTVRWLSDDRHGYEVGSTSEVTARCVIAPFEEVTFARAARVQNRAASADRQQALSDRCSTLLGPSVSEFEIYYKFEVHGDGSFGTEISRMSRSTLTNMLEAAYAAGAASTASQERRVVTAAELRPGMVVLDERTVASVDADHKSTGIEYVEVEHPADGHPGNHFIVSVPNQTTFTVLAPA